MMIVVIDALKIVVVRAAAIRLLIRVEFEGVQTYDNELGGTFFTSYVVALFGIGINVNFFAAFRANRCRHLHCLSGKGIRVICISPKQRVKIDPTFNLT